MKALLAAALGLAFLYLSLGWPAARRAARAAASSLALAPAVAGVACSVAVAASLLTRTSMVPWLSLLTVIGWIWLLVTWRRSVEPSASPTPDDVPGPMALAAAALVAVVPVLLVDLPAVESDARWIWWFHAAWFRAGGEVARDGMADRAFAPSRPGYPPLAPGTTAAVWHLGTAYNREVALRVFQLLTASAVAACGYYVAAVLRLERRWVVAAAGLVAALCWGANAQVGLRGFVDLTWAAWLVPAAVLLLAGPLDRRPVTVAAVLAMAAALTKYEGQAAALLLMGLVFLRAGREWRRVAPAGAAVVAAIVGWQVVTIVGDAPADERGGWTTLSDVLGGESAAFDNLVDALSLLAGDLGPLVGLGVAAVLAMVLIGRLGGTPLRQPGLLSLLVLAAGYLLFLALTLTDFEFAAYRTVIFVRILVLVDVVLAAVASARALGALPGVVGRAAPTGTTAPGERPMGLGTPGR